ncbi:MAG: trypsin-like peptidase domain-containing protein [Bifidobacterium mongoliense]|jgi:putative serine protease PepD|uniref:S1C family serine protease n=1 Tax=Bifidobacterium mongoliense TaxID=518643 RepID=UPI002F35EA9C
MAEEHDGDWMDRLNGEHHADDGAPEHGAGGSDGQGGAPDTTETRQFGTNPNGTDSNTAESHGAKSDGTESGGAQAGAVTSGDDQPTAALPNASDPTVSNPTLSMPTTVIQSADDQPTTVQEPAGEGYRPAPEYGAYGPTPTQPTPAQPTSAQQFGAQSSGAPVNGGAGDGRDPNAGNNPFGDRNPYADAGAYGNPYADRNPYADGNGNPYGEQPNQYDASQQGQRPAPTDSMNGGGQQPPMGPQGPGYPQRPGYPPSNPFMSDSSRSNGPTRSRNGGAILAAVVAAVVTAVLCLGVGFAALSSGLISVPTSGSMSSIGSSSSSKSGSAPLKPGQAANWTEVSKAVSGSVVSIQTQVSGGSAKGSGAIIDTDGHIVTNNHVISGASVIQVTLANGQMYAAKLVGADATTDLAVIKLDNPPSDLKAVTFADSEALAVGEGVMAIGNPLGYDDTATTGIVSALNRPVSVTDENQTEIVTNAVQIDAAINPGNSGGPTFNAAGEVVGINSSIATASSSSSSSSSSGSIGIGFAIPSNLAKRVAQEIVKDGSVKHVKLGVTIQSSTVESDGVTRGGAKVVQVSSGSPADKAGLKSGDTIVAFNGHAVNNNYSVLGFVRASALNDKVKLTVVRDGKAIEVDMTLDQQEDHKTSASNDSGSNGNNNNQNGNGDNNRNGDGSDGFSDPFGLW